MNTYPIDDISKILNQLNNITKTYQNSLTNFLPSYGNEDGRVAVFWTNFTFITIHHY